MTGSLIRENFDGVASLLDGWDISLDFQAPTIEEIEGDLGLRSPAWTRMLLDGHRCARRRQRNENVTLEGQVRL